MTGEHARFVTGHNVNRFSGSTVEERMWARIDRRGDDECWPWVGATTPKGYGSMKWKGTSIYGHRWTYEQLVGPIPDGMQIDHLCRETGCVNPAHLEPVTAAENMRRMREYHQAQQQQGS